MSIITNDHAPKAKRMKAGVILLDHPVEPFLASRRRVLVEPTPLPNDAKNQKVNVLRSIFKILLFGLFLVGHYFRPIAVSANPNSNSVNSAQKTGSSQKKIESIGGIQLKFDQAYGNLPLAFESNEGQTHPDVKFLARGNGYNLFLTAKEAVMDFKRFEKDSPLAPSARNKTNNAGNAKCLGGEVLRMKLEGASEDVSLQGLEDLPGVSHYLIGKDQGRWHRNVPQYSKVKVGGVYPGVDVVYYGHQGQLEYDFQLKAGVDPKIIRVQYKGADSSSVDESGNLILEVGQRTIQFRAPAAYQEINGIRSDLAGKYVQLGKNEIGFEVDGYDASQPLVIDPVLDYSSYLNGSMNFDGYSSGWLQGLALDSSGDVYVCGYTSETNFPTTAGAYQTVNNAAGTGTGVATNGFISKFNMLANGSASLVFSTYLGGDNSYGGLGDMMFGITLDSADNIYLAGTSQSSDFPTTAGAFQTVDSSFLTGVVVELNSTGSGLIYSTYLGGSNGAVSCLGVALDPAGDVYVLGSTSSTNFPLTASAYQSTNFEAAAGNFSAFVSKFNFSLSGSSGLLYSTYLGGSGSFHGSEMPGHIVAPANGFAYVDGGTYSTNFPTTTGAYQTTNRNVNQYANAFLSKLNTNASGVNSLVYSTYLGGSGNGNEDEGALGLAVDASGDAYLTGFTGSSNFPVSPGAYESSLTGIEEVFLSEFDPTGSTLLYSTYLGGIGYSGGIGVVLDNCGDAYITGWANDTAFPTTAGAYQTTEPGPQSSYVSEINPLAAGAGSLVYSTYFGGSGFEESWGIGLDAGNNIYIGGVTSSSDLPTTANAFQTTATGSGAFFGSAYVAKFSSTLSCAGLTPTSTVTNTPTI